MVNAQEIIAKLPKTLKIGTRGSKLALAQAYEVKARLEKAFPDVVKERPLEIITIKTTGDKILDKNLSEIGGKGLFIKEIEEALLDGSIDIAVHSMKDMPAEMPEGLVLDCILERENPHDAFVSKHYNSFAELPKGATVGTSSSRRGAQLLAVRPDVKIVPFRGNVITRLEKLEKKVADATFLAVAGLNRLDLSEHITQIMPADIMLPAVAQGAIGIQQRAEDEAIVTMLAAINHEETAIRVAAERGFLIELGGSCSTPMAAHAVIAGESITLDAMLIHPQGTICYKTSVSGNVREAAELGHKAGRELKSKEGASAILGC